MTIASISKVVRPPPAPPGAPSRSHYATGLRLIWLWAMVALFYCTGERWLADPLTPGVAIIVFVLLFGSILAGAFGVVRQADYLAHDLGEPYGTLILTLSIVVIEVILIASVLLGPGHNPTIGRDAIVAVMMIIINLVMGICLLTGGLRYGEQAFNVQGTSTYMAMIILLTGLSLVLPTFTSGAGGFTPQQAGFVAGITIILYAIYLTMQMRGSRRLFVQPPKGAMTLSPQHFLAQCIGARAHAGPASRGPWVRVLMLLALVIPIVLLAHHLARVIHYGIDAMGAPVALGGVLIAIIVFTPESITAVRAARNNQLQRVINLCLGALVSTVGLTVPVILVIGLITGQPITMGISSTEMVLFAVTMAVSMLSFNGQRTVPIQGLMHLALFAVFGFLLFFP